MVFGSILCDRCRSVIDVELVTFDNTRLLCEKCRKLNIKTVCAECRYYNLYNRTCSLDNKEHNLYEACTVSEIDEEGEAEDEACSEAED